MSPSLIHLYTPQKQTKESFSLGRRNKRSFLLVGTHRTTQEIRCKISQNRRHVWPLNMSRANHAANANPGQSHNSCEAPHEKKFCSKDVSRTSCEKSRGGEKIWQFSSRTWRQNNFWFLHKHRTHGTANDAELVGGSDQIERVLTWIPKTVNQMENKELKAKETA